MSFSSSVPGPYFGNLGFVAPLESAILSGVTADTNAAFGGQLDFGVLTTPQGQWSISYTAVIGAGNDLFVQYTNQVDPAYSSGRMQDAIARIYFIERNPPLSTVLQISCGGAVGVPIPANALIKDTSGNIYGCSEPGTIQGSGTVTLEFAALDTGPIPVPGTNSVSIYQAIPQWNTVTCVSGTVGTNVETRAAFEARRQATVQANARGSIQSITGNIWANVPGVLSVYGYSNNSDSPITVQGVTIPANAIYVAVVGGTSAAIAQAIWAKAPPGPPYYGNTTVTVTDTSQGYNPPYPAYSVTFEIPVGLTIFFAVALVSSSGVPANAATLVQGAILSALAGNDGFGPAASIGGTVYASRFYAGIAALGPWAQIMSMALGSANAPTATLTGAAISGTTLTFSSTVGTVAIGQAVVGVGVMDGTYILSGASLSWVVSVTQSVSSETMYCVAPTLSSVDVNINQMPGATALDIVVTT